MIDNGEDSLQQETFHKHASEWEHARYQAQKVALPRGDQIPTFLLAHWVEKAAGATRLMRGLPEQGDM